MINSFKTHIAKAIQTLESRRAEIMQALKQKPSEELTTALSAFCETKCLKMLISVLESDFDLKDETIQSLFLKIDRIRQELIGSQQQQPSIKDLLDVPLQSITVSLPIPPSSSPHPKLPTESLNLNRSTPSKKSSILKRIVIKQKLKTQSTYRDQSDQRLIEKTLIKDGGYYSEKKMSAFSYNEQTDNHWQQVFKIYHKLPLGILKENSFEQRSLSYKTVNYQKIVAFISQIGLSLNVEHRLHITKILRKNALNHKFVTKNEFKDVYCDLQRYFRISDKDVQDLIEEKEDERKVRLSTEFETPQVKKYRDRVSESVTKRPIIQKNKVKQDIEFLQKSNKIERTYTMNAIHKLKSKQLTWQVLFHMPDASQLVSNSIVPTLDLNRQNQAEDSYYLRQFYDKKYTKAAGSTSPIKPTITPINQKAKLMLPSIKPPKYSYLSPA